MMPPIRNDERKLRMRTLDTGNVDLVQFVRDRQSLNLASRLFKRSSSTTKMSAETASKSKISKQGSNPHILQHELTPPQRIHLR